MDRNESIKAEVDRITNEYRRANPRAARKQYPASKAQIARLAELGLLDYMPAAPYSKAIGYTEAELVIKAAETGPSAVFNAYGEGEATGPSALNSALSMAGDDEQDGSGEVARYIVGDETYLVARDGDAYALDAEWSDGPAAIFDHLPSAAEVEEVHRAAMGALETDDALRQLEVNAAVQEEARQLEVDAAAEEPLK